jgi:hypothetical protein
MDHSIAPNGNDHGEGRAFIRRRLILVVAVKAMEQFTRPIATCKCKLARLNDR